MFKDLAKKASGGDKKSVSVYLMMLPDGLMPEGMEPKDHAKTVSDDESFEDYELEGDLFLDYMDVSAEEVENDDPNVDEQGTGFADLKLKKALYDSLSDLDLNEETMKAVCGAVYDGIVGGGIFPRLEKGQEHAEGEEHAEDEEEGKEDPEKDSVY